MSGFPETREEAAKMLAALAKIVDGVSELMEMDLPSLDGRILHGALQMRNAIWLVFPELKN